MPTWDATADFEEGDVSDFSTTLGTPTASTGSKKNGSYGCEITVSGSNEAGLLVGGFLAETHVTAECWWDPNSATSPSAAGSLIYAEAVGGAFVPASVQHRLSGGNYQLRVGAQLDSGAFTFSSFLTVTDDWHLLRLVWRAATGPGANDGLASLYVDGVLLVSVSGVDNDTRVVGDVYFGLINPSGGSPSGTFYFDTCRIADESEFIFEATGAISAISGSITKAGAKSLTGAISSIVGVITKAGAKPITGAIAMAGAIERSLIPHVITAWAVARQRRPTVAYKPPEGGLGSIVEPLVLRNAAEPTNFLILRGYDDEQLSVRSQAQGRQLSVARVRRPAHARPSREDAE